MTTNPPNTVSGEDEELQAILVELVNNFASQDGTGEWWGFDTSLGDQKDVFEKASKALKTYGIDQRINELVRAETSLKYWNERSLELEAQKEGLQHGE